jgi:hypothetical protein
MSSCDSAKWLNGKTRERGVISFPYRKSEKTWVVKLLGGQFLGSGAGPSFFSSGRRSVRIVPGEPAAACWSIGLVWALSRSLEKNLHIFQNNPCRNYAGVAL